MGWIEVHSTKAMHCHTKKLKTSFCKECITLSNLPKRRATHSMDSLAPLLFLRDLAGRPPPLAGHLMPRRRQSCHRTEAADTCGAFHNATLIHKQYISELISRAFAVILWSVWLQLSFPEWFHCIYAMIFM